MSDTRRGSGGTRLFSVTVQTASEKRGAVRGNRETASEKREQNVDIEQGGKQKWKADGGSERGVTVRYYGNLAVSQHWCRCCMRER